MDDTMTMLFVLFESTGYFAPIAFILFHLIRPFVFVPVALVCIVGGILFGSVIGTIYSIIGLTVFSLAFYIVYQRFPKAFQKIISLKQRWFGDKIHFTIGQISILRLIPFINFHLISICLIEICRNYREYTKASILTNIPVALFYTVFGQFISKFSPSLILMILIALLLLFYLLREKLVVITWHEFFKKKTRGEVN